MTNVRPTMSVTKMSAHLTRIVLHITRADATSDYMAIPKDKRLLLAANDAELEKAISLIRCLFKTYKDSLMSSKQNQFIRRKVSFYNR